MRALLSRLSLGVDRQFPQTSQHYEDEVFHLLAAELDFVVHTVVIRNTIYRATVCVVASQTL